MMQKIYWAGHIARNAPELAFNAVPLAIARRTFAGPSGQKILIGTHHKALTVFLSRVFRVFATITNRTFDVNPGYLMDYSKTVLFDHHSAFQWEKIPDAYVGMHVIRDPRDIIVSSAHYHTKSAEEWLHKPDEKYQGQTYQQTINALPSLEERILFEIQEASGVIIRDMMAWDYGRKNFVEFKYDQLLGDNASENFARAIAQWHLKPSEKDLLVALFRYFSLGGPGVKKSKHIRNPNSGQWQDHFTPRVQEAFDEAFPGALDKLGFE